MDPKPQIDKKTYQPIKAHIEPSKLNKKKSSVTTALLVIFSSAIT